MATVRTIDWPATVTAIQAKLNGPPAPTQAMIASGVTVRNTLSLGGLIYDTLSSDGILNKTAYAATVQAWSAQASAAWIELDRVCRAIYKILPPPSNFAKAAFGMPGVAPWQANAVYNPGSSGAAVVPTVANGFTFDAAVSGKTGAAEPRWNAGLGKQTVDGTVTWTCIAAITGPSGGQPIALPWDLTLATFISLNARNTAAVIASAQSPGLQQLLTLTIEAFFADAIPPTPNPTADALSLEVNQGIVADIANVNAWITAAAVV